MATRPQIGVRSRGISSRPPARHESQSRVRSVSDRSLPSTIPPRPLPTAADLAPLEWWLDAHMNVASNLLCLEPKAATEFLVPLGELRDALYELYCDCGDPRMHAIHGSTSPLAGYVAGLYALCDEVLEMLAMISGDRSGPADLVRFTADIRTRCVAFEQACAPLADEVATALATVSVDATNPVDPLRDVREHFRDVVRAAGDLVRAELSA